MKIFAIGRNYAAHVKEMKSDLPKEPVVFIKPQSALVKNDMPFDMPQFSKHVEYEVEIFLKICRNGKNIPIQKASEYYKEIGVGIDFTARDIQQRCKENGLPWELAKAFDHSAPVSECIPLEQIKDLNNLEFRLEKNKEIVQKGNTKNMIFNFDQIISHISKYFTLNIGDLVFTGTPEGVGKVQPDDLLEAYIGENKMLSCEVKNTVKEPKRSRTAQVK